MYTGSYAGSVSPLPLPPLFIHPPHPRHQLPQLLPILLRRHKAEFLLCALGNEKADPGPGDEAEAEVEAGARGEVGVGSMGY